MNLNTVLISVGWIFVGVYTYEDPKFALKVLHSWRYLKYEYDATEQAVDAEQNGGYDFRNNIPVDVEIVPDGRTFVTILREKGVPASLATIGRHTRDGPLLRPYPDWSWTNTSNCDNIIEVYRTALDECNRLWVLDTGKVDGNMVCNPKLLAFDLSTNELVQRVDITPKLATNADGEGLLVNLIVDTVGTDCGEISVYMADSMGNGLVIWDGNNTWRIDSPYFAPDPNATEFSAQGIDFHFSRGVLGLSITPKEDNSNDRLLYFRPMSSYDMFHTQVADLHLKKHNQSSIEYSKEPTKLRSQSLDQAFSSRGILFFSGTTEQSILCWNQHKPFIPENIVTVAQNERTLLWASGMKIYPGYPSETLAIMTDHWDEHYTEKIDFNKTNFRVLVGSVDDLLLSRGDDQSSIEYFEEPTKLASPSAPQAFSNKGILFFNELTARSLLCWNRHKPFTPENIVTVWQNDEMLQFVSGLKIFLKSVYMISNRFQDVATNTMNYTEFNFRVMLLDIESLVNGTNCE